ncbi:MAG: cupin domain-containing protein [Candidatus Zixiibacteriota bacterium]|nr:MAG: cupin domain-containing protein [candidate division Zixibacteria bacterium]
MPVISYDDIELADVKMEGADKVLKAIVISEREGWDDYVLRVVRLGAGGFSPEHSHDWEHVNYVISGRGKLHLGDSTYELAERDFAFVPPEQPHQFENPYEEDLEFICIVPSRGEV